MNNLREALTRVTVWDLYDLAPYPQVPPPNRDGLHDNPFRDHRERTPSFSVGKDGRCWKDFSAGAGGGLIDFVERCRPDLEKREVYRLLVERAGLDWSEPKGSGKRWSDKERRAWAREQRRREREALDRTLRERKRALEFPPRSSVRRIPAPSFVRARWASGLVHRWSRSPHYYRVDDRRGWPRGWAEWMNGRGLMGLPELPWSRGEGRLLRGLAWPVKSMGGEFLGYHQLYADYRTGEKRYVYVPPPAREEAKGRSLTEFEKKVFEWAAGAGLPPGESVVPALPLALGSLEVPETVVVMEGQWDALTLYGGLFKEGVDEGPPVAIFGLRGVSGVKIFLAEWGDWLKRVRPRVILIPDNDAAGKQWTETAPRAGALRPVTFESQLINAGLETAVVKIPEEYGSDFNDYFRARQPNGQTLRAWLKKASKTS